MGDLFKLTDGNSLISKLFENKSEINLRDYQLERESIPKDYKIQSIHVSDSNVSTIKPIINPIVKEIESKGYDYVVATPLYEAVKNAYQHGNNNDSSKKITVGYKISKKKDDKIGRTKITLDMMVEDSGGILVPKFVEFILQFRSSFEKDKKTNWYDFSGMQIKEGADNQGVGTNLITSYSDRVQYYASENGGLIVHFTKSINSKK